MGKRRGMGHRRKRGTRDKGGQAKKGDKGKMGDMGYKGLWLGTGEQVVHLHRGTRERGRTQVVWGRNYFVFIYKLSAHEQTANTGSRANAANYLFTCNITPVSDLLQFGEFLKELKLNIFLFQIVNELAKSGVGQNIFLKILDKSWQLTETAVIFIISLFLNISITNFRLSTAVALNA